MYRGTFSVHRAAQNVLNPLKGYVFGLFRFAGATVANTLYLDGLAASALRAFSPLQPEETYSMVTANRFWSQVFGVAQPELAARLGSDRCR